MCYVYLFSYVILAVSNDKNVSLETDKCWLALPRFPSSLFKIKVNMIQHGEGAKNVTTTAQVFFSKRVL